MSRKDLVSPENNGARLAVGQPYVIPAVDIFERDGVLTLTADLPGVKGDGVRIKVERGILWLEAQGQILPQEAAVFQEFFTTGYFRQFPLPEHLDLDRIEARFENGVLTLKLPKAEAVLPRWIEVKTVH
jgi:HSP20 family molecular chaperone IbpA